MPGYLERAHSKWAYEYRHENLGKKAVEREAIKRGIPKERINAVLWYPIKGFDHSGEPCECKAMIWLNGICLGCGKEKVREAEG